MKASYETITLADLDAVLARLPSTKPNTQVVLGPIRMSDRKGEVRPIRVLVDGVKKRPYVAAYENLVIILDRSKVVDADGKVRVSDAKTAMLHELSHAKDELSSEAHESYHRTVKRLRALEQDRLFLARLFTLLDESKLLKNRLLKEPATIEENEAMRAEVAMHAPSIVRLLSLYKIPSGDRHGFLYVLFLKRAEDRLVKDGSTKEYFRSLGEMRARAAVMYEEAKEKVKGGEEIDEAIKKTRSYRYLRRRLPKGDLGLMASEVKRRLLEQA